jgi:hypothetical protein
MLDGKPGGGKYGFIEKIRPLILSRLETEIEETDTRPMGAEGDSDPLRVINGVKN